MSDYWSSINTLAWICVSQGNFLGAIRWSFMTEVGLYLLSYVDLMAWSGKAGVHRQLQVLHKQLCSDLYLGGEHSRFNPMVIRD